MTAKLAPQQDGLGFPILIAILLENLGCQGGPDRTMDRTTQTIQIKALKGLRLIEITPHYLRKLARLQ